MTDEEHNTPKDNWETPEWLITVARYLLTGSTDGTIDLDLASNLNAQARIKATEWFGPEHTDPNNRDGTSMSALYPCVASCWCNPPYSRGNMFAFAEQMVRLKGLIYDNGALLSNAVVGSKAGQLLLREADAVLFFERRIGFYDPVLGKERRGNDRDQMMALFGADCVERAKAIAGRYGTLVQKVGS